MSGTTRADKYTQKQKAPVIYSDFLDEFFAHPVTGDIVTAKNEQSIKQSLRNLINTDLGERFFQAQIGSNVRRSLFELNDSITAGDLKYHIQQTIQNNEPRVALIDVVVAFLPTQDSVHINIVFAIINTNNIQNLELLLKRVR